MKDMKLLREADMPYFEELEKAGKAVILRIDPERLINLDIEELLQENDVMPTDQQIAKWLEENDAVISEHVSRTKAKIEKNTLLENNMHDKGQPDAMDTLMEMVRSSRLSDEDNEIVQSAVLDRLPASDIIKLLNPQIDTQERKALYADLLEKKFEVSGWK